MPNPNPTDGPTDSDNIMAILKQIMQDQADSNARQSAREAQAATDFARLAAQQTSQAEVLATLLSQAQDTPRDTVSGEQIPETPAPTPVDLPLAAATKPPFTLKSAQPPSKLTANITLSAFSSWMKSWHTYSELSGISSCPPSMQVSALRTFLDHDMITTLETRLRVTDDTDATVNEIMDKIKAWLRLQRNIVRDKVEFQDRVQKQGESFNAYLVSLHDIARNCEFCPCSVDDRFITNIIRGVHDPELRKKLLEQKVKTLEDCINICETFESTRNDNKVLSTSLSISAVNTPPMKSETFQAQHSNHNRNTKPNQPRVCRGCHGNCKSRPTCPSWGKKCPHCGIPNHLGAVCRYRSSASDAAVTPQVNTMVFNVRSSKKAPRIQCNMRISQSPKTHQIVCLPDTGAEVTCMGWSTTAQLGLTRTMLDSMRGSPIRAANGVAMPCFGSIKAELSYHGKTTTEAIHVFPQLDGVLLSWYACLDLGILPATYPLPAPAASAHVKTIQAPYQAVDTKRADHDVTRRALLEEFQDVFDSTTHLKPMITEPMRIQLRAGATPFHIRAARPIPYAWREKTKQLLDNMVSQGIIAPIEEPTAWCAPMHVTPKHNGDLRIVGDMQELNKHVIRPIYPLLTPRDAVAALDRDAKIFSTLDAKSGYWQVPLEEASQALTTFLTPWGRYKYCRATMGLVSSGDEYNQRGDEALGNLPRTSKVVDDILVHDTNYSDHVEHLRTVLLRCRQHGITLNPGKFVFAQTSVDFVGYKVSSDGTSADPKKLNAISAFPTPTNITELRSFFGMVEQLSCFSPSVAAAKEPLRPLLQTRRLFQWLPEHDMAFQTLKSLLLQPPILAFFDPTLPVVLETDASRLKGLGYALLQKQDGNWRLIDCGSRFLSDTETRYAMIELECLGVAWAVHKCRLFLQGQPTFTIVVDHKPLVPILNHYSLAAIENPRLQRLKEKLAPYTFTVDWRKGKDHRIPDALSRAPVDSPTPTDLLAEDDEISLHHFIQAIDSTLQEDLHDDTWADRTVNLLRSEAKQDPSYVQLYELTKTGFPKQPKDLPEDIRPYFKLQDELFIDGDGLVLRGTQIVVPRRSRSDILVRLHAAHQGIVRTKQRARQAVYWPGMTSDITNTVESCTTCQEHLPSQSKEPYTADPLPSRIFESTSADFFEAQGRHFLIYADRLSGWPSVTAFGKDTTTTPLCLALAGQFSSTGIPVRIRSDGGPQFISLEFTNFCEKWGINHSTSSPHYPQSNGHAEVNVKKVKQLIHKCTQNGNINTEEFHEGLLELRNTPSAEGRSPAQIVYGHPMRSRIPLHHSAFASRWQAPIATSARTASQYLEQVKNRYDKSAHSLPSLSIGDRVRIQDARTKRWSKTGHVTAVLRERDYQVRLDSGAELRRNRRFLRPVHSPTTITKSASTGQVAPEEDAPQPSRAGMDRVRKPPQRFQNSSYK